MKWVLSFTVSTATHTFNSLLPLGGAGVLMPVLCLFGQVAPHLATWFQYVTYTTVFATCTSVFT